MDNASMSACSGAMSVDIGPMSIDGAVMQRERAAVN